jgi:hypothetical protein
MTVPSRMRDMTAAACTGAPPACTGHFLNNSRLPGGAFETSCERHGLRAGEWCCGEHSCRQADGDDRIWHDACISDARWNDEEASIAHSKETHKM